MPLKKGVKNQGHNIRELLKKYKKTGHIGNSKPPNLGRAIKQAVAISYRQAGEK